MIPQAQLRRICYKLPRERLEAVALSCYILKQRQNNPLAQYRAKYYKKPLDWIDTYVHIKMEKYMRQFFGDIQDGATKIAIHGPHGIGKTVIAALLTLWGGSVSEDAKLITTASAWRQLSKYLWPEIHKWYGRINWKAIGFAPEMLMLEAHFPGDSMAFAVACSNSATIEGAHARRVFYVYDEAKTIPQATWEASEGAFSGQGDHLQVALSTPGDNHGEFFNICSKKPGFESWRVRHVSLKQAIRAGRIRLDWARDCRKRWGKNNPVYWNRVWGLFAENLKDGLIPYRWVQAAIDRWYKWQEDGAKTVGVLHLGADIARGGEDRVTLAHRHDKVCTEIECFAKDQTKDTMITTGRIIQAIGQEGIAKIDVIGVGSGVVDRAREIAGERIIAINAAEGSKFKDRSGELEFANIRAAMYWNMRELLDPENNEDVCLPDDPELVGDLTAPTYSLTSGGKILIESKDKIREKINRSPDKGDAVVQSFFDGYQVPEFLYVG
jgi:hypothetical protein